MQVLPFTSLRGAWTCSQSGACCSMASFMSTTPTWTRCAHREHYHMPCTPTPLHCALLAQEYEATTAMR